MHKLRSAVGIMSLASDLDTKSNTGKAKKELSIEAQAKADAGKAKALAIAKQRAEQEAQQLAQQVDQLMAQINASEDAQVAGEEAVEEFLALESRPTAIFCANDLLALGMMRGLLARGIRIPDEISIIGYDDIEFAPSAAVPLTSIAQPAYQLGTVAAQLLLSECEGIETHAHQEVHFQPELVVRNSTRDVASARAEAVVRREYAHLATSYFGSSAPA